MSCRSGRWRGYLVVLGGVLIHLTLGTVYTFGNMTPYITSYMRRHKVDENLNYATSTWISAVASMGQGSSMFLGGIIYRKFGPKIPPLIGGWTASLGVFLTYFTIKISFLLTILTYGALFGLGVGIAYATPMGCAMKWLPEKKGLVNGFVVAGFGGGAFIFNQVQTAFLNPSNLVPDLEIDGEKYFDEDSLLDRLPNCFLMLGGCYAFMQFIGCMLLVDPPDEKDQQHLDDFGAEDDTKPLLPDIESENTTTVETTEDNSYSPKEVLKTRAFYTLWCIYLFNGQGIQFISSLYKAYGQTFIKNDKFLALVGSFAAVCNGGGRIMWGHLADRFSFKSAMVFSCGLFSMFIFSFGLTSLVGEPLFFIYVCALFLCFSGNFSLLPTATAKSFGQKYYGINYGMVFTSTVVTSPISAILTSSLKNVIGWYGMFYMVSAFSFSSAILAWSYNIKKTNGDDI